MSRRFPRWLRRTSVFVFSVFVVALIVVEDVLRIAGALLRALLPEGLEKFLQARSNTFAFCVVGVALIGFAAIKAWEAYAFAQGQVFTIVFLVVFSKVYFIGVLGYLCRVYSDRLLAVAWIRKYWEYYLGAKDYMKSLAWYKVAHAFVLRVKARFKAVASAIREKLKGSSVFAKLWRAIRARYRRST